MLRELASSLPAGRHAAPGAHVQGQVHAHTAVVDISIAALSPLSLYSDPAPR